MQTSCEQSPHLVDLGKLYGSLVKCQAACTANAACNWYYLDGKRGYCFLFDGTITPAQMQKNGYRYTTDQNPDLQNSTPDHVYDVASKSSYYLTHSGATGDLKYGAGTGPWRL